MSVEWRPVVGYEGLYDVSNCGNVRRVAAGTRNVVAGRILKASRTKGYWVVSLFKDLCRKQCYVHRLVVEAFLGPIPDDMEVNHKDGIKLNCCSTNLEVVTHQQNAIHAHAKGLVPHARGERHSRAKLTAKQVEEIRREYRPGRISRGGTGYRVFADRYEISVSSVGDILSGKNWKITKGV